MRASGLTHLLSVSGLHVAAVVGAAVVLARMALGLVPGLALRLPLLTVAAGTGALAGISYTLLSGAEVPTVRSCIAALLILTGFMIGREAVTLRLVAAGALAILILWPQALVGASFQLSFAAVASIVALYEVPAVRRFAHDGDVAGRVGSLVCSGMLLLLTGLVVELALAPIAFAHFHRSGFYGALANIIAIPLTTFVIMPLEALALLVDLIVPPLGWLVWVPTGWAIDALLTMARWVAARPGAQMLVAEVPALGFGLMMLGELWIILWKTRVRLWGFLPLIAGVAITILTPAPDVLITGDGRHMLIRGDDGRAYVLRGRAGDFVRAQLGERAGVEEALTPASGAPGALCSRDLCRIPLNGGRMTVLATISGDPVPLAALVRACATADLVVSDRALPRACAPRWLRVDRPFLRGRGGVAITFAPPAIQTVRPPRDDHPWVSGSSERGHGMPPHADP